MPPFPTVNDAIPYISPQEPHDFGATRGIPEATVASEIPEAKILFAPQEPPCVGNRVES